MAAFFNTNGFIEMHYLLLSVFIFNELTIMQRLISPRLGLTTSFSSW